MKRANAITRSAALAILVLSAITAVPAPAATAHVHGRAALEVAVDGNRLLLNFSSPLDNLVGFEHAPRNDKQTAAVRRMAGELHKPAVHFVPTPEALCTASSANLESPVIEPSLLTAAGVPQAAAERPPAKAQKGKKGSDGHASLSAEIAFRCEHPEKLVGLEVRLFDAFRGLQRIDVQVAGARKQAAARLTPRSRRISW